MDQGGPQAFGGRWRGSEAVNLRITNANKFITWWHTTLHLLFFPLLLMIPAIHPDVRLIYCSENYTLACSTDVTNGICDCYFKWLASNVVSLWLSWEICDGITPSQHFCAS